MGNKQTVGIEPALRKRPKLVWVISIYYILTAGFAILTFFLISIGAIQSNALQKVNYDSQSIIENTLLLTLGSLNFLGAIYLFLLRRYAYHCFLIAFAVVLVAYVYHIIFKNWLYVTTGGEMLFAVIGLFINIAIILYSKKLINKEILR